MAYPTHAYTKPRLIKQFRHTLNSISFPKGDSSIFVTTGDDQTVRVWDLARGEERLAIQYEKARPQWACYTPDNTQIAVASNDGVIRLHDNTTGRLVRQFRGHTATATHVAFDSQGRRMVTSSDDLTVRIWDVETGMTTLILRGHVRQIRSALLSADERYLVSVGDGPIKIWDAHRSHDDDDGRRLAAGTILEHARANYENGLVHCTVQVVNATENPLPIPHSARPGFGLRLYLAVERLGDDPTIPAFGRKPDEYDQYPMGYTRFLPVDHVMEVGHQAEMKLSFNAAAWPPGKYRLHLEHGWPGASRSSQQHSCIVVVPEQPTK
jgi:hypothetical protein